MQRGTFVDTRRMGGHDVALLAVLAIGVFAVLLVACPGAEAANEPVRVFDPSMSLTGNCSVSTDDPVADPGCPGGAHPAKPLTNACGAVTDSYGDVYVASAVPGLSNTEGRIDVFSASGNYLTEIKEQHWPCDLAVDSEGNVYVLEHSGEGRILLFAPTSYPPHVGTQYSSETEAVVVFPKPPTATCGYPEAIAVDPSDDHLYVAVVCEGILEFGSAAENLPAGDWPPIGEPIAPEIGVRGMDVDGATHDIYAAAADPESSHGDEPSAQRIYIFDGATGDIACESDGGDTPRGQFSFVFGNAAIAIDQSNHEFYVDDTKVNKVVDHFDADCGYLDQLPSQPPELQHPDLRAGLAVDAPCLDAAEVSCDLGGYHSPSEGTVYVGSGQAEGKSHLFAFPLKEPGAPEIEAQVAGDVTDTEAELAAELNPHALQTTYRFEYISQADYEADGGEFGVGVQTVPVTEANGGDSASFLPVSESVAGLTPGTRYRFRLIATNCSAPGAIAGDCLTRGEGNPGGDGEEATFVTYLGGANGLSDHRGYELVTPPDTGGYVPTMNELGFTPLASSAAFTTDFTGPGGESLLFGIEGGSLPGLPGGGFHDTYEAHREADGPYGRWRSEFNGIDGGEVREPTPSGFSSDHTTSFWAVRKGAVAEEGNYIRRSGGVLDPRCGPDPMGHLELIGCGSIGTDAWASGGWISAGAGHVVFATINENGRLAQQLEPQAPPTGTPAVYDRTSDGVTHVVSLKPGGTPFAQAESASYEGTSADGSAVAFAVGGTLYVRLDDEATVEVATSSPSFGGLSEHGDRAVYLQPNAAEPHLSGTSIPQGEIFSCDVRLNSCAGPGAQAPVRIGSGDKSVLVNVSADGSHVYFAEENQLYVWDGSSVHPVTNLVSSDLIGHEGVESNVRVGGLGLWVTNAVAPYPGPYRGRASDPSRTTPTGAVFVFESHANITSYDSGDHTEIYRYDSATGDLACLSCNPTGGVATSDAQLQADPPPQFHSLPPANAISGISNVSANGRRVFFQSRERLVLGDTDGKLDVYEWESNGEGDCGRNAGCLSLISSGHSAADDYLYSMGPDGRDVFFESGDLLTPRDTDASPSIYDARVDGGEAPGALPPAPCIGEACQAAAVLSPDPTPASSSFDGPTGRVARSCGSAKGKARRGKTRCANHRNHKNHHRHSGHRRAHSGRRTAR